MKIIDAIGQEHLPAGPQPRIVALVPSLTELLCDLGLAGQLVGRTGFCVHPRAVVRGIAKLGGTKGFDRERLRRLAPTHVLVNVDENRRDEVDALRAFVPHVVVTHPLGPDDNPALYRLCGDLFACQEAAERLIAAFRREQAALAAAIAGQPRLKVLYLIWRKPWMSVGRDTYISRMLAAAGLDTLPAAAAVRYPEVSLDLARDADLVLLPSEPYPFRAKDVAALAAELRAVDAVTPPAVLGIDGEMVSWYGSRAVDGLAYLRRFSESLIRINR